MPFQHEEFMTLGDPLFPGGCVPSKFSATTSVLSRKPKQLDIA
jgi:hypothetical protein